MRKHTPLHFVLPIAPLGMLIALGAHAVASPAAPGTQPVQPKLPSRPEPRIEPSARIASVKRTPSRRGTNDTYADGSLSFDVEIVNTASSLSTSLILERVDGAPVVVAKTAVAIGAAERGVVAVVDEGGLKKSCEPAEYRVKLEAGGASRRFVVKPTCSFGAEVIDPGTGAAPEGRARPAKITYHSPSLTPATLACGMPVQMKATVRNDATTAATAVRLVIDVPSGTGATGDGAREIAASLPFELLPGREARQTVQLPFAGAIGDYTLRVEATGAPVNQPGWHVAVTRSCALAIVDDAPEDMSRARAHGK